MARADTYTLLALEKFASILGIPPPHFNTAAAVSLSPAVFPLKGQCDQVWWQYAWQMVDRVSRDDLARVIDETEEDIAHVVGYYPAPKWISQEMHRWTLPHRPDVWGASQYDSRGELQSVETKYKKVIAPGRRAVTEIEPRAVVAYTDVDSDGLFETATITVPGITTTDECELKAYFDGHNGEPEWEIRPAVSKTLVAGVLTMVFRSWLLIEPDLWEAYPTDEGTNIIDISTIANFVVDVDIYREYNDTTQASSTMYWEPGFSGAVCPDCGGGGVSELYFDRTGWVFPHPGRGEWFSGSLSGDVLSHGRRVGSRGPFGMQDAGYGQTLVLCGRRE